MDCLDSEDEAASSSGTSFSIYQSTLCHIREDLNLWFYCVWSLCMCSVCHCVWVYMSEYSVLFQPCVLGLGSMGTVTNDSAGSFACLQNIIFQNCFMIACGQTQTLRGHLSRLNMRLKVCIILKPEDMSHCSPFIKA